MMRRFPLALSFLVCVAVAAALGQVANQSVQQILATTCTNQFIRSLAATGAGTCATVVAATDVSGLAAVATSGSATDLSAGTLAVARGGAPQGAWTAWTPSATCGTSGTITSDSVSGRYNATGKQLAFFATINITTLGTCLGNLQLSVPTGTAQSVESPVTAFNISTNVAVPAVVNSNSIIIVFATAPAANSYSVAGVYETQ